MSQTDNTTTQAETKSNVLTGLEVIETLGLDDTIYHSELFQQQCPKCEIPCQSQNCPHYEGSFNDVELTDKGKEVIK